MFRLNIECTKDIDEIHINFSDGSSVVKSKDDVSSLPVSSGRSENECVDHQVQKKVQREQFLDTDADYGFVSQEVVKLPEIENAKRPVNVAAELQNLDI